MLTSKYSNPLENFVAHGVKVDNYTYILLVDEQGQAVIQRVSSDQSEIKFAEMTSPGSNNKDVIAAAIDTFWADYNATATLYSYLFQVQ